MSVKFSCVLMLGAITSGCAPGVKPVLTDPDILPLPGAWTTSEMTYVSNCEDTGGGSDYGLSFLDTTLLYTVPDYTEVSYEPDGAFYLQPETITDDLPCSLERGQFNCPEVIETIQLDGVTMILKRNFEGYFYPTDDPKSTHDNIVYANEGEFFFTSEWTCENGECGWYKHLECKFESHFTVTSSGQNGAPFEPNE